MPSNFTTISAATRTFGVEIECYLPEAHCPDRTSHVYGTPIEWAPEGWQAKRDGSLTAAPEGYRGVELVSPKLAGEQGLIEVVFVADFIRDELAARVNATCGVHVHVDASDLSPAQVERVKALFIKFEQHLYTLCGEEARTRYTSHYCSPSTVWGSANERGPRYRALNLENLRPGGKGSIEFRLFCGSVDAELIVTAIQTCVALVVKAANYAKITSHKRVDTFLRGMVKGAEIVPDCPYNDLVLIAALQGQRASI